MLLRTRSRAAHPQGLDVNVRFTDVNAFEFTGETAIFDLLRLPLVHGWLVDPADAVTAAAVGTMSYNALVERLVSGEAPAEQALALEAFLESSASQARHGAAAAVCAQEGHL